MKVIIGYIRSLKGTFYVKHDNGIIEKLKVGDPVYSTDFIYDPTRNPNNSIDIDLKATEQDLILEGKGEILFDFEKDNNDKIDKILIKYDDLNVDETSLTTKAIKLPLSHDYVDTFWIENNPTANVESDLRSLVYPSDSINDNPGNDREENIPLNIFDSRIPLDNSTYNSIYIKDPNNDGFINMYEVKQSYIYGQVEPNSTIDYIYISDGNNKYYFNKDQINYDLNSSKYSIENVDVSQFNDGTLTVIIGSHDRAGNFAQSEDTIIKDTTTYSTIDVIDPNNDNYINRYEVTDNSIKGSVEPGNIIDTITISDGTHSYTFNSDQINYDKDSGKYSIDSVDVSQFNDGTLTIKIVTHDEAGNYNESEDTIIKDTTTYSTIDVIDPNNDNYINRYEVTDNSIKGSVEPGNIIDTITISDGIHSYTFNSDQISYDKDNGKYNIDNVDVSQFNDGTLTVKIVTHDEAGNYSESEDTIIKDTTTYSTIEFKDINNDEYVNRNEQYNLDIKGSVEPGNIIDTITISDGTHSYTFNSDQISYDKDNGKYSIDNVDVSQFNDGTLTVKIVTHDKAGNYSESKDTIIKDTTTYNIVCIIDPNRDCLVNENEEKDVVIKGKVEPYSTIDYIYVTDGEHNYRFSSDQINYDKDSGYFNIDNVDLSQFNDGRIYVYIGSHDEAGNYAKSGNCIYKDTGTYSTIDFIDNNNDGYLNIEEAKHGRIEGSVEPGNIIDSIAISDGTNNYIFNSDQINYDPNSGKYYIDNYDLTKFNDGQLEVKIKTHDNYGHYSESYDTIILDTEAPNVNICKICNDTGVSNSDFITSDNTLYFIGQGDAGSKIDLYLDGEKIGETTINSDGYWCYDYRDNPLTYGDHTLKVIAYDEADNSSSYEQLIQIYEYKTPSNDDDKLMYNNGTIDGWNGNDTLLLHSNENIDFSNLPDKIDIKNIENIDLDYNGSHSLSNLTLEDVIEMTDSDNILTIIGGSDDSVNIPNTSDNYSIEHSIDGNFDIYTYSSNDGDSTVTLKIEHDIDQY